MSQTDLAHERHLSLVQARLNHLVNAIASGKATEAVYAALQTEEAAKKTVLRHLAEMDALARVISLDATRLERTLLEKVTDVKALLGKHVPQARQMLRKLIDSRIVCTPFHDVRGRGYELTATGTYAGLLGEKLLVSHGGGEGGIRTHGPFQDNGFRDLKKSDLQEGESPESTHE